MKSEILSDKELRIFNEQIRLPEVGLAGQERIKQSRILVIGAGGKGTSALRDLVAAGTGHIGICDNYLVEEISLPKQSLYGEMDLGKQKAIISKQRLASRSSLPSYEIHNICLSESNIRTIMEPYDIILDATDNFPSHYLISDAAIVAGKPVIFGSVVKNTALVAVFNHNGGPSLRCLYPSQPKNGRYSEKGIPAISLLYSITGSMMAHEALNIILDLPSHLNGKLLQFRLSDYNCTFRTIQRNPDNFTGKGFI